VPEFLFFLTLFLMATDSSMQGIKRMPKVLRKNLWSLELPLCQRIFSCLILARPEALSVACVVGRVFHVVLSFDLVPAVCAHKTIEIDLPPYHGHDPATFIGCKSKLEPNKFLAVQFPTY